MQAPRDRKVGSQWLRHPLQELHAEGGEGCSAGPEAALEAAPACCSLNSFLLIHWCFIKDIYFKNKTNFTTKKWFPQSCK